MVSLVKANLQHMGFAVPEQATAVQDLTICAKEASAPNSWNAFPLHLPCMTNKHLPPTNSRKMLPQKKERERKIKIFHAFIQNPNNLRWKKLQILQLKSPHPEKALGQICSPPSQPSSSFYVTVKTNAYNLTVQIWSCRHSSYRTLWIYFKHKKYTWYLQK